MSGPYGSFVPLYIEIEFRLVSCITEDIDSMADGLTLWLKRLFIAMAALCVLVLMFSPFLNSQTRHLWAIDGHIAKIDPLWRDFRATHSGFEGVELFGYTGGDGMFGAYGYIATDAQLEQLRKFMESTAPPRPVYLESVRVVGQQEYEMMLGDKSHRFGSESNRTSSAPAPIR
jgi:hypothetical protein